MSIAFIAFIAEPDMPGIAAGIGEPEPIGIGGPGFIVGAGAALAGPIVMPGIGAGVVFGAGVAIVMPAMGAMVG